MTVRLPVVWLTIFFAAGILLGKSIPSDYYILAAGISLAPAWYTLRTKSRFHGLFVFLFWLLLGAARMSLPEMHLSFFEHLQSTGTHWNKFFVTQLQESGLKDRALAMVSSLLLGNRSLLSPDTKQAFSLAGASHLLALSGMHLGILYSLIYFLIIKRIRHTSKRLFALPLILLLIWSYALLTGFPSSLVRASIMLTLSTTMMLSPHLHAYYSDDIHWELALHTLALSALIMLLFDPLCLWDIGCQLSYSAMLAIVLCCPQWKVHSHHKLSHICNWAIGILNVSLVAQIGTMPLVAYYFHTIAPIGILLNLILIPLTMVIIYAAIPLLLFPIPWLAKGLSILIGAECSLIEHWVAIPGTSISHIHPTIWETALIYTALLLLSISLKMNSKKIAQQ